MSILKKAAFGCVAVIVITTHANAQRNYPTRPIQLIIPYAVTGSNSIILRQIAPVVSEKLGQSMVVINRPGGGSVIGTAAIATGTPDGHTIGIVTSNLTINESMLPASQLHYKPKDFQTVTSLYKFPMVLTASSASGIKTFNELLQRIKANPDKLNYGSAGIGSAGHMSVAYLEMVAKIRATHIPFSSTGSGASVASGTIDFQMAPIPSAMNFINQGRMVPLGISDLKRVKALPNVPTLDEQGLKGFQIADWTGLVVPRNTPSAAVEKLSAAFQDALSNDEIVNRITSLGTEVWKLNATEFRKFIDADVERWKAVTNHIKSRDGR